MSPNQNVDCALLWVHAEAHAQAAVLLACPLNGIQIEAELKRLKRLVVTHVRVPASTSRVAHVLVSEEPKWQAAIVAAQQLARDTVKARVIKQLEEEWVLVKHPHHPPFVLLRIPACVRTARSASDCDEPRTLKVDAYGC